MYCSFVGINMDYIRNSRLYSSDCIKRYFGRIMNFTIQESTVLATKAITFIITRITTKTVYGSENNIRVTFRGFAIRQIDSISESIGKNCTEYMIMHIFLSPRFSEELPSHLPLKRHLTWHEENLPEILPTPLDTSIFPTFIE